MITVMVVMRMMVIRVGLPEAVAGMIKADVHERWYGGNTEVYPLPATKISASLSDKGDNPTEDGGNAPAGGEFTEDYLGFARLV